MKKLFLTLFGLCFFLTGCSDQSTEDYKKMKPTLNIMTYFDGTLEADGILFDLFGRPKRYFHAEMKGEIKDNRLILNEEFVFDDGEKAHRSWEITLKNNHEFSGKAADVVGVAQGHQSGNAVNIKYVLRVPYNKSTLELSMDDWMYLMNEKTIINRTTMKKFGIKVGELLLVIQKKS